MPCTERRKFHMFITGLVDSFWTSQQQSGVFVATITRGNDFTDTLVRLSDYSVISSFANLYFVVSSIFWISSVQMCCWRLWHACSRSQERLWMISTVHIAYLLRRARDHAMRLPHWIFAFKTVIPNCCSCKARSLNKGAGTRDTPETYYIFLPKRALWKRRYIFKRTKLRLWKQDPIIHFSVHYTVIVRLNVRIKWV